MAENRHTSRSRSTASSRSKGSKRRTASSASKTASKTAAKSSSKQNGAAKTKGNKGKLKIGDSWNAITIIALSQNNPLKAIAEFVENSIDAGAKSITLTRHKSGGEVYLTIRDNGRGVPRDDDGKPNFKYVATHICDSIKRELKARGNGAGLQGEFGIGLLSFWTVGETLLMTSCGKDKKVYQMTLQRGDPGYRIVQKRGSKTFRGTELEIGPLLSGLRLSGEKIQWYLASELRDRIHTTGVKIAIEDKITRKKLAVEPQPFEGERLDLDNIETDYGDIRVELYWNPADTRHEVGLYRRGTRVQTGLQKLDDFDRIPWNSGHFTGVVDAPFLRLTPGTRDGIIRDERYHEFVTAIAPLEDELLYHLDTLKKLEEEEVSVKTLRSVQNALKEALLKLPAEEYDWFNLHKRTTPDGSNGQNGAGQNGANGSGKGTGSGKGLSRGALASVLLTPQSAAMQAGSARLFRAIPRDRVRTPLAAKVDTSWNFVGEARGCVLRNRDQATVELVAGKRLGLVRIQAVCTQGDVVTKRTALITIAEHLSDPADGRPRRSRRGGVPGYTFRHEPGRDWRSRFDADNNLVVINTGHRDFIYAQDTRARRIRYIARLFSKEMVLQHFPGMPHDELLERMVELSLYVEEHLT